MDAKTVSGLRFRDFFVIQLFGLGFVFHRDPKFLSMHTK